MSQTPQGSDLAGGGRHKAKRPQSAKVRSGDVEALLGVTPPAQQLDQEEIELREQAVETGESSSNYQRAGTRELGSLAPGGTVSGSADIEDVEKPNPYATAGPRPRGGGGGGGLMENRIALWVIAIIVALAAGFLIGFLLGGNKEEGGSSAAAPIVSDKCLAADADQSVCDPAAFAAAMDGRRTLALYEQLKAENKKAGEYLQLDTMSMLEWTDKASAGIFNYWAHNMDRPQYTATFKKPLTLELRGTSGHWTTPHVFISAPSNQYQYQIVENLTIGYDDNVLSIHSTAFSPAGQQLDFKKLTGVDTVWGEYVGAEPVTVNSDENVNLLQSQDGKAVKQKTSVDSTLPIEAAVDAAAFMGAGGTGGGQMLRAHWQDRRIHSLSSDAGTTGLPISGTLTQDGKAAIALETKAIPGPITVAGVTLYNMSLTLGSGDMYKFKASGDFKLGRHDYKASVEGHVGFQARKGADDTHVHDIALTGSISGAILIEGEQTRIIAKPLRLSVGGYLEAGLPSCDPAQAALGPCVAIEGNLGATASPTTPTSSTLAISDQKGTTYARWKCTARVSGTLDFGTASTTFDIPLGHHSDMFGPTRMLSISLSGVQVGAAMKLDHGKLFWSWPDQMTETAELSFNTTVDTGATPLMFNAKGRMTHGQLLLQGHIANWKLPFGSGVLVNDLLAELDIDWDESLEDHPRCTWGAGKPGKIATTHNLRCPSLDTGKSLSEEECRAECDKEPLCNSFQHRPSLGICCLLDCKPGSSECPTITAADSYTFDCAARDQVSGFVGPFPEKSITGHNDLGAFDDPTGTLDQCAERCRTTPNCTSFDFGRKDASLPGSCFLSSDSQHSVPFAYESWPGYDYYETAAAHTDAKKEQESNFRIDSGTRFQSHTAAQTALSKRRWKFVANSTLNFGGGQYHFSFAVDSRQVDKIFARLTPTGNKQTLEQIVAGVSATAGSQSITDPDVAPTTHLSMVPNAVRLYTKPLWIRATVNEHFLDSGMPVHGILTVKEGLDGTWAWGVVLQTARNGVATGPGQHPDAFALEELVPEAKAAGAFSNLRLSHGVLAVANHAMNVTVAPGIQGFQDLPDVLKVNAGVTVGATIQLTDVAPVATARNGAVEPYIRVFGSFKAKDGPTKLALAGEVKGPLAMTSDLDLDLLRIQLLSDTAGSTACVFSGKATLKSETPGKFAISGSMKITPTRQEAQVGGTITNWAVTPDIVVDHGKLDLSLSRDFTKVQSNETGGWNHWQVSGDARGYFTLYGVGLVVKVPIPLASGITSIEASMDSVDLGSGAKLIDITANASFAGKLEDFLGHAAAWDLAVGGTFRIANPFGDAPIDVRVTGKVSPNGWDLTGTLVQWEVANGVVFSDVQLQIYGNNVTEPAEGQAPGYTFGVNFGATADIMGKTAQVQAGFRKSGSNKPKITGTVTFPSGDESLPLTPPESTPGRHADALGLADIKFNKMAFTVEEGVLGLDGSATINTDPSPIRLNITAEFQGPTNGTCENWRVPSWMHKHLNKVCAPIQKHAGAVINWQSMKLRGSVETWQVSPDFSIDSAVVDLSLLRVPDDQGKLKISATGFVEGEVTVSGVSVAAHVPVPPTAGVTTMRATSERLEVGGGVALTDVVLDYSGSFADFVSTSRLTAQGTVRVPTPFAQQPEMAAAVNGEFTRSLVKVNGRLTHLPISGGLSISDLAIAVHTERAPTTSPGCYEVRKGDQKQSCSYEGWHCSGDWCASMTCNGGECGGCATLRTNYFADPETGRCVSAICYEADTTAFPTCDRWTQLGYSCVGTQCAVNSCVGDCTVCANRKVGLIADAATGKCISPWSLKSATIDAKASLMGLNVGYTTLTLPWQDGGKFTLGVTDLEVAAGTTLTGNLVVQEATPQMSLNGKLNCGQGAVFDVDTVFSHSDTQQSAAVKASSQTWVVGSKLTVNDVSVDLTLTRNKNGENWEAIAAEGRVIGDLVLAGIRFTADVPIPIDSGVVSVGGELPVTEVTPGVTLALNVQGVSQGGNMTELLHNSEFDVTGSLGIKKLGASGQPATAAITGKFGKDKLDVTGQLANWEIVSGVELSTLQFTASSTGTLGAASDVAVSLSATMNSVLGDGTAVTASFTKTPEKKPRVDFALTGPFLIGGVNIATLNLVVPGDGTAVTFSGTAELPAVNGGSPGNLALAGSYVAANGVQRAALQGSVSSWQATSQFTINNVEVDLDIARKVGNETVVVSGEVNGDFEIAGMQLIASVPLPLMSAPITAEAPEIKLAPGVRLEDLHLKVGKLADLGPAVSAECSGRLNVSTPLGPSPSVILTVEGNIGNGQMQLSGTLSEWMIVDGLLLKGLTFDSAARSTTAGWQANVSLSGATNVFGLDAGFEATFSGGKGHRIVVDGDINFPNGSFIDWAAEKVKGKIPSRHAGALSAKSGLELGTMDFNYAEEKFSFNMSAKLHGGPTPAGFHLAGYVEGIKAAVSTGVQLADQQHIVMTGYAEKWQIADSLTLDNLNADLDIVRTNVSTVTTGSIEGQVTLAGLTAGCYIPIPIASGTSRINATFNDISLGPVTLATGFVKYEGNLSDFAKTLAVDFEGTLGVATPFAKDPEFSVSVTGKVQPKKITVAGSTASWAVADAFTLANVQADAVITKAPTGWSATGNVAATGLLLGGSVEVATVFPWTDDSSLDVQLDGLKLADGLTVTTGTMSIRRAAPQFSIDGHLAMGSAASPLHIAGSADATATRQQFKFASKLGVPRWEMTSEVAVEALDVDLTLTRTRAASTDAWGGWDVNGLLQGRIDWGGIRVFAHVPLPLDDATILNATFPALSIGNVVAFNNANIEYRGDLSNFAKDPKLNISATVKVATPFAEDDELSVDVVGYYSRTYASLEGKVTSWNVVKDVISFEEVEGAFATSWNPKQSTAVSTTPPVCYQAATADYPQCVSWDNAVLAYHCLGELGEQQCARDGCRGDCEYCAERRPGMYADPATGTCAEALCYEAQKGLISGCDYSSYHCVGNWCAVDGCVGDCGKCAERKYGLVADAATGRCASAICYEGQPADFAECDHAALGYTCVDGWCTTDGDSCTDECARCGHRRIGFKADSTTGRCRGGKWEVTIARAKASATVLGTKLAGVNWDFAEGLEVNVTGLKLGGDMHITKGYFVMKRGDPIRFNAAAKIKVGPDFFVEPDIDGVVHNTSHFALNGSLATGGWDVLGFAVRNVEVKLVCSGSASSALDCKGNVFGRLSFWDNIVEVNVPVPFNSGDTTVYLPRMQFAEGTYLENTLLRRTPGGAKYELSGNMHLTLTEQASPLQVTVQGSVTPECFQFSGSTTAPWTWSVGKGFSIDNVQGQFSVGKACPGRAPSATSTVAGSVSGQVALSVGTMAAALDFGPGKGADLEIRWTTGNPPSLLGIAGSLTDQAEVAGKGSGSAADSMGNVAVEELLLLIHLNATDPSIWIKGRCNIYGGRLDLVMNIAKDEQGKTYFVAALDIPAGTDFATIEPSQSGVSKTLGPLKGGHLAIATKETTFQLNSGRALKVSPGVNFRAVIAMDSLGGQLGAGTTTATPSELEITGHWAGTDNILLKAELSDFPLGDHVLLDATAQFSTTEPIFQASGVATMSLSTEVRPVRASAEVHVWRGGDLDVFGSMSHWTLDVGENGLLVEDLKLNISKRGKNFRASFTGTAFFNMSNDIKGVGIPYQSGYRIGSAISQQQRPCQKDAQGLKNIYGAECVFDGDAQTLWDSTGHDRGNEQWVEMTYEAPRRMTGYHFSTTEQNCPAAWTLQGSNIEGSWHVLDSRTGQTCSDNKFAAYQLPPAEGRAFRYFRWVFSSSYTPNVASSGYRLREIKMDFWNVVPDYVVLSGTTTCINAGFPTTTKSDQCAAASAGLGLGMDAALTTPDARSLENPAGCYVQPGECEMGWLPSTYGFQPEGGDYDVDGSQPLKGKTLSECIAACEANPSCKSISRGKGRDDLPGDCWLKKTLLPVGDSNLKHTAACDAADEPGADCAGAMQDASKRGGLSVDAWCTGTAQEKSGLGCAQTCCNYWADAGKSTCMGNGNGRPCQFPFVDKSGVSHAACVADATGMPQCRVVGDDDLWGNCECAPRYGTYIVRCPAVGYTALSESATTCAKQHMTMVDTKDWCAAAGAAAGVSGSVTEVSEESSLGGCQKRGGALYFNTKTLSEADGSANGATAICHSGPSLWFNDINAQFQGAGLTDPRSQQVCNSQETRVGMYLDVDVAGRQVNISLRIRADQSMTPASAISSMAHPTAVGDSGVPSDFTNMLDAPILDVSLFLSTSPPMLDIRGTMMITRIGQVSGRLLIVKDQGSGKWNFALGVSVNSPFTFEQMAPSYSGNAPKYLNFGRGSFVVSSFPTPFTFMNEKVTNGVVVSAYLPLTTNEQLQAVRSWTGVDELMIRVSFGFADSTFRFEGAIYGRWYIIKPELSVTGGRLFVEAGAGVTGGIAVGLGIDLDVMVGSQVLEFQGEMILSPIQIEFGARMLTEWHSPFGLKRVDILRTEVALGIQYVCPEFMGFPCPSKIGLAGGLRIKMASAVSTAGTCDSKATLANAAFSNGNWDYNHRASWCIDRAANEWSSPRCASRSGNNVWLRVEIPNSAERSVCKVVITNRLSCCWHRLGRHEIWAGDDSRSPSSGNNKKCSEKYYTQRGSIAHPVGGCKGRYLFVYRPGPTDVSLNINEVTVYYSKPVSTMATEGSAAILVDKNNPAETLFAFSLTQYSLDEMNQGLNENPKESPFGTFSIQGFHLSVNPASYPKEFAGKTYVSGIHAKIDRFTWQGVFSGSGEITISLGVGIHLWAQIEPMNLFGGMFKLGSFDSIDDPARLELKLNAVDPMAEINGGLELFGQKLGLYLWIDKSRWELKARMELLGGMLKAQLMLNAVVDNWAPTDFSGSILFEQDIMQWIADQTQQFINQLKQAVNKQMDAAQADLDTWLRNKKPTMDRNKREIQRIRDANTAAFNKAKAWLDSCTNSVRNARNTVNSWKSQIDSMGRQYRSVSCKWYQPWDCAADVAHNAWVGTKIAGLWVAHKAAQGVLWAAEKALNLAKSGLTAAEKVANAVDPRVVALQAENLIIQGAYEVARIGVEAARAVINGAADLANFVVQSLTQLFNVKRIFCSASNVMTNPKLRCDFAGEILGRSWSFGFDSSLPPKLEDVTNSIKDAAKAKLGL